LDSAFSRFHRRKLNERWAPHCGSATGIAAMYGNERETGHAVADSGMSRDQLYVVMKL
jgi:hypothetical protein